MANGNTELDLERIASLIAERLGASTSVSAEERVASAVLARLGGPGVLAASPIPSAGARLYASSLPESSAFALADSVASRISGRLGSVLAASPIPAVMAASPIPAASLALDASMVASAIAARLEGPLQALVNSAVNARLQALRESAASDTNVPLNVERAPADPTRRNG